MAQKKEITNTDLTKVEPITDNQKLVFKFNKYSKCPTGNYSMGSENLKST